MDIRVEIRDFLASRRARLTPEAAGLPVYGGNRRVKGLRREEVALLAGVSVDYYTQLERGRLTGVSDSVLGAVGRALQLDEAEHAHLYDLAKAVNAHPGTTRTRPSTDGARPTIQRILDAMTGAPAVVRNACFDLLAGNTLGKALYSPVYAMRGPANTARFAFLDPAARVYYQDWERTADDCVAILHCAAGRNPCDRRLTELVGELCTRSSEFRTRWAAHDIRYHRTGTKRVHHPEVGDLELTFEVFEPLADPGLHLLVYGTHPGTASEDALRLLASLHAASPEPADRANGRRAD